jgi:hypothetical protein
MTPGNPNHDLIHCLARTGHRQEAYAENIQQRIPRPDTLVQLFCLSSSVLIARRKEYERN